MIRNCWTPCATLLLTALLPATASSADAHWIQLHSTSFDLYTTAGARNARDTLTEFEQVRGFFAQTFGASVAKTGRVRLIVFNSAKEFEPFRLNEYAIAYYHQSPEHDSIVMDHGGIDTFPIAVHEYVHLLARHQGLRFPPWLNEGLAEFYSTLHAQGDRIVLGGLVAGRYRALLGTNWVPLSTILTVDRKSPYYNEKDKAGSLYNEGWALTHMLYLDPRYRPKFHELTTLISSGTDSREALMRTFGKSISQIDHELMLYLRSGDFRALVLPAKLDKSVEDLAETPLADFDRDLALLDLLDKPGREVAVRTALEQLMARQPHRPEPYEQLAYLAWRQRNNEDAFRNFAKAYELGDREPYLLWDYGRFLEARNPTAALPVLAELLAQAPDRMDARLELAEMYLRQNRPKDAIALLGAVRTLSPDTISRFFHVAVAAHLADGDVPRAKSAADRFLQISNTDGQRAEARELQEAAGAAHLSATLRPARPAASGRFVDLDCDEEQARMMVDTADGKQTFLIEDPSRVQIARGQSGPVNLVCGPQAPPLAVRVEYDLPAPGQTGIRGVVRLLSFE